MIDSHLVIKITDFGLSEDVFVRNYFRQGTSEEVVKLPVKWMAPESLSDGHFSEKSDVWSYGVTMWEVFSGGKSPYPGTDPVTLIQMLEEGDRLPKPYNVACTKEIHQIMMKCWEAAPDDRPSFKELHKATSKYTERIAGYLEIGYNPFAGMEKVKTTLKENEPKDDGDDLVSAVSIQVTPPPVDT
jgi:serine/threonine protein kinase